MLPISSIAAGSKSKAATVASIDSINSKQCSTANPLYFGVGTTLNLASVIVTSVPSEPTTNLAMLKLFPPTNSSRLYPETRLCILGYRERTSSLLASPISKSDLYMSPSKALPRIFASRESPVSWPNVAVSPFERITSSS